MITYPISNRDLFRSVMIQIPAAGVQYSCSVLQEFAEDEQLGLCVMNIKKLPEIKEWFEVVDQDGIKQRYLQTRQNYEVQVEYKSSELEFLKALEIGSVISNCNNKQT